MVCVTNKNDTLLWADPLMCMRNYRGKWVPIVSCAATGSHHECRNLTAGEISAIRQGGSKHGKPAQHCFKIRDDCLLETMDVDACNSEFKEPGLI